LESEAGTGQVYSEDNYLSFSLLTPFGIGYKHHLGRDIFTVTDLEYEKKDLHLRAGYLAD
jgi:hypothetical protein